MIVRDKQDYSVWIENKKDLSCENPGSIILRLSKFDISEPVCLFPTFEKHRPPDSL